jgi:group I intron endonuclease
MRETRYGSSSHFHNALRLYGLEAFEWKILDEASTKQEANEKEIYFIKLLEARNPEKGYNILPGGDCIGPYALWQLSERMKANNPMKREEVRKKVSEHHVDVSGKNNPMYGKPRTEDVKHRISEAHKGMKYSEKTKALRSAQTLGAKNPKARAVQCVETNESFGCIKDAQAKYGKIAIYSAIKSGRTAGKLHWKDAE